MANVEIPNLPVAIGLDGTEQMESVQNGTSCRVTTAQIAGLASGLITLPQSANRVYAGPASGVPALPTFRALVTADFPTSGVSAGTYGDSTHFATFTVDATGRLTAAAQVNAGSVTSVGLSAPSEFTVSGSPVTGSGVLTFAWLSPVAVNHGGTGLATYAIGDLIQASAATTLARLASVATGNALISGGVTTVSSWGKIGLTTHVSGVLPVANGGTNIGSYTIGDLIQASAAGVLSVLNAVATGNALISGGVGTISSWGKIGLTTHVSGTLGAGNGGTGNATYAVGDLLQASAATTLARLAAVATGNVLISGGVTTVSSWGKVGLTTHVSGTLGVGNGGTGLATYAVGDLIVATGTTTLASLADVATGSLLGSKGVGVAPGYVTSALTLNWSANGVGAGLTPAARNNTTLQTVDGLGFPATQVSSSDANTLDDYEEGTWTPGLAFGGAAVGIVYTAQNGYYTKIGRQVTCSAFISISSKGSSSGPLTITGLPFTPDTSTNQRGGGVASDYNNWSGLVGTPIVLISASAVASIKQFGSATAANVADTNATATSNISLAFTYFTAT